MKDFKISATGDLEIAKGDLQFVSDKELTLQKVQLILSTNKGEWELDENEGINFSYFQVKSPSQDEIISTIREGLKQVDETFEITEYSFNTKNRHLALSFKARNDTGEEINLGVYDIQQTGTTIRIIVCDLNSTNIINAGDVFSCLCVCDTDSNIINCKV